MIELTIQEWLDLPYESFREVHIANEAAASLNLIYRWGQESTPVQSVSNFQVLEKRADELYSI